MMDDRDERFKEVEARLERIDYLVELKLWQMLVGM